MKKLLFLLLVSSACAQVVIGGGRYITGNPGNVGPTLSSISITPHGTSSLAAGSTLTFTALGTYSDTSTQDLTAACLWASSAPSVLALGTQGVTPFLTTGLKAGSSTVSCSYTGVTSNTDVVTVTAPTLQTVTIAPSVGSMTTIAIGASTNFIATGSFSDGSSQDISATCTWATTNAGIASLGTAGDPQPVNGVSAGTANISCTKSAITSNSVTVTVVQVTVTTMSLPQAQVGTAYSATLAASGGTPPYTWSISSGSLPPGLSLTASTGAIGGTPTTNVGSPFSISFVATDSGSIASSAATLTLTVNQAVMPPGLMITSGAPPNGQTSTLYGFTPSAVNGQQPYNWSAVAQNLGTISALSGNNTSACGPIGFPTAGCYGVTPAFSTTSTNTAAQTQTPEPLPGQMSSVPIQNLLYSGFNGEVYCELQPWFSHGSFGHPDIGMDMHNTAQILAILNKMAAVGCTVVWVDAYYTNVDSGFDDATLVLIAAQLATGTPNLKLNILVDQGSLVGPCPPGATDQTTCISNQLFTVLDSYNTRFFGQSYYTKSSSKPIVTFFVTESNWSGTNWTTVWANVRSHTNAYASGGIKMVFRFGTFDHTQSDGEYAWVQPPVYSNGSPTSQLCWDDIVGGACNFSTGVGGGTSYLNTFYAAARVHPTQLAIGGIWPGFDWSNASYNGGVQKIIQRGCGQLPALTAAKIAANGYGSGSQLYAVGIDTWNDYGEGTGVEPGIDNCIGPITLSISTNLASWTTAPTDSTYFTTSTIQNWRILYADASGNAFVAVDNLSAGTSSQDLMGRIPPGTWTVYVRMRGTALIQDKMSNGVTYTSSAGQLLPTGLNIALPTGAITGTPTVVGTWPFTFQIQDSLGAIATQNVSIAISAGTPTLKFTSVVLPGGKVASPYNFTCTTSGGAGGNVFSIIPANGLPPGITLNSSTCAFTGTPTQTGTFGFTLQVKDSSGNIATQIESVLISASGTSCGPPSYACSSTSTLEVNTPAFPFSSTTLQNSFGCDTSLNPSNGTCGIQSVSPLIRATDPSFGPGPCWETWSGGANDNPWNSNDTLLGVMCNNSGSQTIIAFDPVNMKVTGKDAQVIGGTITFSRINPLLAYRVSNAGTIFKEVFTITNGIPSHVETQLINLTGSTSTCSAIIGQVATATFYATIDTADTYVYTGIFLSGQNSTGWAVAYRIADGKCSTFSPSTGVITDFNGNSLTETTCTYTAHDGQMSKNGVWGMVSAAPGTSCNGQTKAFWKIGTSTLNGCIGNSCQGHESWGYEDITVISNPTYNSRDPAAGGGSQTTFATQTANINETHFATNFVLTDDSQAVIAATGNPNLTPWPGPLFDEVFAVKRNGQFVRFFHTWGSWTSPYFRVAQGILAGSQTGHFAAVTTDGANGSTTACPFGKDNANNCRSDVLIGRLD